MNSIIQISDDRCFNCGMAYGSEWHHLFGKNPQRQYSEADGLKVRMCPKCHGLLHCDPKLSGPMQDKYHRLGQTIWEAHYGPIIELVGKSPREEFIRRYGKNYLPEEENEGQLCNADGDEGQY